MSQDIFEFWAQIGRADRVHPADRAVLADPPERGWADHSLDLKCLPSCYMGPLRTARVVLLYLSPGFSEQDYTDARTPEGQNRYALQRTGQHPLPSSLEHEPAWRWWTSRSGFISKDWAYLRDKIAFLNIGAYHSAKFSDWGLLAALPSSRVALSWAQDLLFPDAEAGNRIVICLRAASYWGLKEGRIYKGTLFAPSLVRSGHMVRGDERQRITAAARQLLQIEPA